MAIIKTSRSLDEIEISATSNQNKSILYQPASITKLPPVELKCGIDLFMEDAIQTNVPGVTMNLRTLSGGQQFNISGYGIGTRGTTGVYKNSRQYIKTMDYSTLIKLVFRSVYIHQRVDMKPVLIFST